MSTEPGELRDEERGGAPDAPQDLPDPMPEDLDTDAPAGEAYEDADPTEGQAPTG